MALAARPVEAPEARLHLDEVGRVLDVCAGAALLLGGVARGRRLDEEPGLHSDDAEAYRAWLAALRSGPYRAARVSPRLADGRVVELWGINLLTADPAALVVEVHAPTPSAVVGGVDRLTGLPDRAALCELGDAAIRQAGPLPFGLLHLDLDRLKGINDTLGHAAGDLLLVEVARRVRSVLRSGDVLGRLGGDEFVVMLPCAPLDVALAAAQRIERAMRAPFRVLGHNLHAQVSIGTASYPRDAGTFEALLQCADMAMFHAKRNHLGRASYEPHLGQHTRARVRIEAEIHRGLEAEEFELFYQPVLDLRGPATCRAEALMRWRHPSKGLVLPGEFVSVAEDTGSIVAMDRWALLSAARQVRAWFRRGLRVEVAVNLSARTFRDPALPAWLDTVLAETGIDPGQLGVEITESTAMGSAQETVARMGEFIGRGLTVALDDFGTGYSSLAYLKHFHVHVLKVDRSFVRGIGLEPRDEQLIEVVALLAKSLGVRLVAEGVETEGQLRWLDDRGCDHVQGYTVARPMPAPDVGRWWAGRELVR